MSKRIQCAVDDGRVELDDPLLEIVTRRIAIANCAKISAKIGLDLPKFFLRMRFGHHASGVGHVRDCAVKSIR